MELHYILALLTPMQWYYLALVIFMPILARAAGGGMGMGWVVYWVGTRFGARAASIASLLPEVFFSLPFGHALAAGVCFLWGDIALWIQAITFMLGAGRAYAVMQSGHGSVLPWGRKVPDDEYEFYRTRTNTYTRATDYLALRLKIPRDGADGLRSVPYCRLYMAIKGFLLCTPTGGIINMLGWPSSYQIGVRCDNHALSELISGVSATAALLAFYQIPAASGVFQLLAERLGA